MAIGDFGAIQSDSRFIPIGVIPASTNRTRLHVGAD